MTACSTNTCGVGGWGGPLPGDPDNNSVLSATPAFGGIDVAWSYPTTNPSAVAHVLLYRATTSNFGTAMLLATVGGNFFYDKTTSTQLIQYYYWITIVSANGTVGALIGPASAIAKPPIASVIEGLTDKIDAGLLAQSLKTEIDKITLNYSELTAEIANRISGNAALSAALADVQSGVAQSLAFIDEEIIYRQEGDSALVTQLNTVAAVNAQNAAAILTEQTARVTEDEALASSITTVAAAAATNAAAITTEATARANADSALSSQITTAQSTLNGNISSVQTSLQTNINTVDGKVTSIGALYTAKVTVNGLIGGFGVYNNGTEVEAGFDVDRFWVGRTNADKRKPFIIENGVTYIDDAVIRQLTFNKLKDESGSFIVENGKVKANYLNVTEITGGAYTAYAWPASGNGFYLGPGGLLMGNLNLGKYVQITDTGDFYAPGFTIVNGQATFAGLLANTITVTSGQVIGLLMRTLVVPVTYSGITYDMYFGGLSSSSVPPYTINGQPNRFLIWSGTMPAPETAPHKISAIVTANSSNGRGGSSGDFILEVYVIDSISGFTASGELIGVSSSSTPYNQTATVAGASTNTYTTNKLVAIVATGFLSVNTVTEFSGLFWGVR